MYTKQSQGDYSINDLTYDSGLLFIFVRRLADIPSWDMGVISAFCTVGRHVCRVEFGLNPWVLPK
jgi:hypothetical protein